MARRRNRVLKLDDGFKDPIMDLKHPKQRAFLLVYAASGNITESCRAADISRSNHHYWLNNNPDYARAFTEARRQTADLLESVAFEIATKGILVEKYYKGKPVLDKNGEQVYERKLSVATLHLLLKATLPEKYRENYNVPPGDDGARIAGRKRVDVIREEIEARQKALEMILAAENQRGN